MKFINQDGERCGVKHLHKRGELYEGRRSGYQKPNTPRMCCDCGNQDFIISHYPVDPLIGMANWDDRYHLRCIKCQKEIGMWNLPDGTTPLRKKIGK